MKEGAIASEAELRRCCEILRIALDNSKFHLLHSYGKEPIHESWSKDDMISAYHVFFKLLISLSKPQQSE